MNLAPYNTEAEVPPDALLDAQVYERVMLREVLGFAKGWAPEGDWSVYGPIEKGSSVFPDTVCPVSVSRWDGKCACEHEMRTDSDGKHVHFCEVLGHCSICLLVVPLYSRSIEAAWEVVERIEKAGGVVTLQTMREGVRGYFAMVGHNQPHMSFYEWFEASGASMSEAICRAALLAAAKFEIRPLDETI